MTRIFLVDDEPLVLIGMQGMLNWSELGYEVAGTARNGAEALKAIEEKHPDIVVSDIRMPVMDGLEATRRIRTSGRPDARAVPIIALTANAFDEDSKKSMDSGMDGHLSKPIQVEQMLELLGRCIR